MQRMTTSKLSYFVLIQRQCTPALTHPMGEGARRGSFGLSALRQSRSPAICRSRRRNPGILKTGWNKKFEQDFCHCRLCLSERQINLAAGQCTPWELKEICRLL